ncbi:MAG: hypothetical protein RBT52_01950 [Sulfurimonas sp.]|jgi:hypothetical protein|nr:hypothetical protein [Sulfurimonas sp.]
MYYAMVFIPNEWGKFNIRAIRSKGYTSLLNAKKALQKTGMSGYIKQVGHSVPVWKS